MIIPQLASLAYNASASLIRFLFVSSSLKRNVQEVYKRNQFTFTFLFICESINLIHILSAINFRYRETDSMSKIPTIFYNACLDPYTVNFYKEIYNEVGILNQIIIFACCFIIIGSNLFLFRFLKKQEISNQGRSIYVIMDVSNNWFFSYSSWWYKQEETEKKKFCSSQCWDNCNRGFCVGYCYSIYDCISGLY